MDGFALRAWRYRPHDGAVALAVAALALCVGYLVISSPHRAQLALVVPAAVLVIARPMVAVVLLGLTLPLTMDLSGGGVGVNISFSDVLLTLVMAAVAASWALRRTSRELLALWPLRWYVGPYLGVLAVLLVAHPGWTALVSTGQRVELILFPLLVGAALGFQGRELWLLVPYVVASAAVGALWIGGVQLGQKNPVGQFIANALILLVGSPVLRRRLLVLVPVLITSLFWTQSRGAILSVLIALPFFLLADVGRRRRTALVLLPVVAAVAYGAFQVIPEEAQQRNLSYSSGKGTAAEWSLHLREIQREQAWTLIHAHPGLGVGVGRYLDGDPLRRPGTGDPHQVLLLQWAEGGYPLLVAFLILMLVPIGVLMVARHTAWGVTAAALTAATMGHGLVDVYWVRGTPVLPWLVVGMAMARQLRQTSEVAPASAPMSGQKGG